MKTKVMQNVEGQIRCITGDVQVAYAGKESILPHNNMLFSVMVNDLVSTWPKRSKYMDGLTILEIIPRNSPSYLNCIVDDIQCFSHRNNMRLNPAKCKAMTIDFLDYNSCIWCPICTGGVVIERVKSFKLLGVYLGYSL